MIDDDRARRDVGIPEGSVLFVSAHITPDHDNYEMYRPKIDPVVYRNWIVGYLSAYQHFEVAPLHRFRLSSGVKWHP